MEKEKTDDSHIEGATSENHCRWKGFRLCSGALTSFTLDPCTPFRKMDLRSRSPDMLEILSVRANSTGVLSGLPGIYAQGF